jgi:hypothetical protein
VTAAMVVDTHAASLTLKLEGNLTAHLTETLQRFETALPIVDESGGDIIAQPDYRISIVAYMSQVMLGTRRNACANIRTERERITKVP